MTSPNADWSHAEDGGDEGMAYDQIDKDIGKLAIHSLDYLSCEITDLEGDLHGWTKPDYQALGAIFQIDWLERLLVPPANTPLDNRVAFSEHIASLRQALPFTEGERHWLFDDPDHKRRLTDSFNPPGEPQYLRAVRKTEAQVMSGGLYCLVRGRDLIQRWPLWRRETGEYADGAGLNQARESLKDVIELLVPELGLPESYMALPQPPTPEA